jgi:hypothetical protein
VRLADTVALGPLIRCPACGNILGEEVEGLAVVRHRERKMVALAVSCGKRGCAGVWLAPGYVELVRRVVRAVPAAGGA